MSQTERSGAHQMPDDQRNSADAAGEASLEPYVRIGHGYDIHRLEPRDRVQAVPAAGEGGILSAYASGVGQPVRQMVLGGVRFEHTHGPVGHSDGDTVLHAVTDAVLGALGEPDLGSLFPDSASENDGRDSSEFVAAAVERIRGRGYAVSNLDVTVIAEQPKIGPRRGEIAASIARMLGVGVDRVNVKGKTHEKVDAVGRGEAVEVHAVVLLARSGA